MGLTRVPAACMLMGKGGQALALCVLARVCMLTIKILVRATRCSNDVRP